MNQQYPERTGRVIEVRKNRFLIDFQGREIAARLKGSFFEQAADKVPVVGDYVTLLYHSAGDSVIQSVCDRKSFLQRPKTDKAGGIQYMVANVDYCFIVTSLNRNYNINRIARYAGVALQGGAMPVARKMPPESATTT